MTAMPPTQNDADNNEQENTMHTDNAPDNATHDPKDAPVSDEQATEAPEVADDAEGSEKGNREAAKYRRKLRDTEAERDQLTTQLTALRTAAINARVVEHHGASTEGFWAARPELANMLTADGTVDIDKVDETVTDIRARFGLRTKFDGWSNCVPNEGYNPRTRGNGGLDVIMGRS